MTLHEWGEEGLVKYLQAVFPQPLKGYGIGDDGAIIPRDEGEVWVVTTDALVEGVHFLKEEIPPSDLGFKTVAVNVSDIAAMGGQPHTGFLTGAFPSTVQISWLMDLIQGIKEGCEKWNLQLLGGDTVGSKRDIFINLTLIGSAQASRVKYRKGAQIGDIIGLTGYIGDSAGGLKALQHKLGDSLDVQSLIKAHFRPQPNPQEGVWLASHEAVHAMMDLSDGLDKDLKRLLKASGVGGSIELTNLPLSPSLRRVCAKQKWKGTELGVMGGEDYCLLFTLAPESCEAIQKGFEEIFGKPLYLIGQVTEQREALAYQQQGKTVQLTLEGFEHF